MRSNAIPMVTATLLFGALLYTGTSASRRESRIQVVLDSTRSHYQREVTRAEALLAAGDSLPAVTLHRYGGQDLLLRQLPTRFRYIYFGRTDCAPCEILAQAWPLVDRARRDSIAFIAFDPGRTIDADSAFFTFAWVHDSASDNRYVNRVPALVVRNKEGRIIAATHGSVLRVASTLDLFHLLPRRVADSLVTGTGGGPTIRPDTARRGTGR